MKTYQDFEDLYIGHSVGEDRYPRDTILRQAFKAGWDAGVSEFLRWRHPRLEAPVEDMGC